MKIVFLDEATVSTIPSLELIKDLGEYKGYDYTTPEQRLSRIGDADVIITNKVMIDRSIIEQSKSLKLICIAATGMNNVDLDAASEMGIAVKNVVGYSTDSVVQITFSLLFELMSHTSIFNDYVHSGEYCKSQSFTSITPPYSELAGKRYGVVGLGNIGKKVASVAAAFGAEVVYYSTSGKNHCADYVQLSIEELLRTSDVISIHSPLNEKTDGLIDKERLSMMKSNAYLINVGRGGIVSEGDLAEALNNNVIAGAGLDVFTVEPISKNNPLLTVKDKSKLVMTPHIAWASIEARERLVTSIALNIKSLNL